VEIQGSTSVTNSTTALSIDSVTIDSGGAFTVAAATTVGGLLNNGTLRIGNNGSVRTLSFTGSLTNNGTINTANTGPYHTIYFRAGTPCAWLGSGDISGVKSHVVVDAGAVLDISGLTSPLKFKSAGALTLTLNGTLIAGTQVISGNGNVTCNFTQSAGALLVTANPNGIANGVSSGTINMLGTLTFDPGANYLFNGTAAQVAAGLPAVVNDLTITNAAGVTLSAATTANGTLALNSGVLTATSLVIGSGGRLAGNGTVNGGTTNNGTLAPGANDASLGTLTFNNGITLNAGSTNIFKLNESLSPANDLVTVTGSIASGGALVVTNLGPVPALGDSFTLFNPPVSGAFASLTLPALPAGYGWTNRLAVDGSIAVVTAETPTPTPAAITNYDVYLLGGQSNADGRGSASDLTNSLAAWQSPQPDIRIYYANPINLDPINPTYSSGWDVLAPGFSVAPGFSGALPSGTFGPELGFARTVADTNANRHVAILKITQGATSLSGDWNPAGGYMYVALTNMSCLALQALTNEGAGYTLRGMIWHQGESDGSLSTASYQSKLTDFINAVRRDFGVTNLPFVVGELATNRSTTVRQAQFNVAQIMPYVGFASSSNLPTRAADDPHFTAASQLTMGQRMAAALEIPAMTLTGMSRTGTNLLLTFSGQARAACWLRAATNLTQPKANWTVIATNVFDAVGQATFVQPLTPTAPAKFFMFYQN
jgi:iduronate 2-sulfatase